MSVERPIFSEDDPEAEAASLARAERDIAAGKVVPHEEVAKWLQAWADGERKPMPREWLK